MRDILLIATWSDGRGEQHISLFGQTIRVGHDPYNDIILPPEFAPHAPYHAAVVLQNDHCYIYDPEGVGAIYLNGKRLDKEGVIKPDFPAFIGNPVHAKLYLRLGITDMQQTQMIRAETDLDDHDLTGIIEPIMPLDLPEQITPYLLASWSGDEYLTFDLDQDVVIVGRSPAANIAVPLDLQFVSGLHFQIVKADNRYFVQDKDSTNGTRLNRTLLQAGRLYHLSDGDIINIQAGGNGLLWFVFHDPLNPKPTNIARTSEAKNNKPRHLWERVWHLLRNDGSHGH